MEDHKSVVSAFIQMSDKESTRDIALEMRGMLGQYIRESTSRREICGKQFEKQDCRIASLEKQAWKLSGALALLVVAWEWIKIRFQ